MRMIEFRIRKSATGEERVYVDSYPDDYPDEAVEFMWTDGNYACDCNRELLWCRTKGEDAPHRKCSDNEYSVVSVTENGQPFPLEIR